jgi:hypothetical protein
LFPTSSALFRNASIYARGLAVNALLVAPFVLIAAAITIFLYRLGAAHVHGWAGILINPFGLPYFFVTVDLAVVLVFVGVVWGLYRSANQDVPEIPSGWFGRGVGVLAILLFVVAFCEIQPLLLNEMIAQQTGNPFSLMPDMVKGITGVLAPVATVITFFASKVGEFVKSASESTKWRTQAAAIAVRALIYVAGLIVPLGIWAVYLSVTYWGLCTSGMPCQSCIAQPASWSWEVAGLFLVGAVVCVVLTLFMRPNANSLHPLYRDRLAKAFLFVPQSQLPREATLQAYRPALSEISGLRGPYHLINAALNMEASKTANKRGRNADFFTFSPRFVGSKSTDYVDTRDIERVAVGLNLATAMATSGAAVSSNMGAQSIKPLTASMALLNVRLGYWMRNPNKVKDAKPPSADARLRPLVAFYRARNPVANYYFLAEIFGLLSEQYRSIYLTDGGHIENLGIYELLRRRCSVIIAVDAEADSQMAFGSFNTLERYAVIDMGIRIDLPWQQIADVSLKTGAAIDDNGDTDKLHGPHCAIGEISYPGGRKGILVYIKASLTGDENDYIFDYKKRHSAFPHETTIDQWFTEEQFEAYRALGFHAAYGAFSGIDSYAFLDLDEDRAAWPNVAVLRGLFGGSAVAPPTV